jgi:mannose-6-phosphate isomerase-like protein (cupin superfamily)
MGRNSVARVLPRHGRSRRFDPARPNHGAKMEGAVTKKPWGYYRILYQGDQTLIKILVINPGQELSLQKHLHRSETWSVESGRGIAHIAGKQHDITEGGLLNVPAHAFHRLINTGDAPLVIYEIQCGEKLSEDDIIRVEDR